MILAEFRLLLSIRERPLTMKRFFVLWLKRLITFPKLILLLSRSEWLRFRGAQIGKLAVVGKTNMQGNLNNLYIGTGASIGECTFILHDKIQIQSYAVVSDGVTILTASHQLRSSKWASVKKPIFIGKHAWIAVNSLLLPGVSIGAGAVVGAGSVVRENVPDFALAAGNPATIVVEKRNSNLCYYPSLLNAPLEAWVGANINSKIKDLFECEI